MTLETLSLRYFGTPDYHTALSVLAPSCEAVRQFKTAVEHYQLSLTEPTD